MTSLVRLGIECLSKSFGDRQALADLSFCLQAGEIFGLLGPNGAGKTTLVNLLCGLLRPDRGRIYFDGASLTARARAYIGVAPQENLLYKSLTCAENLDFFAKLYGLNRATRQRQIRACLAAVNLSDRAHVPVATLSGGMQRRLNVAVALVHQPKLLILDEPTVGLDLEARSEFWALLRALQQQGTTILLATHHLDEAERLCDRLCILRAGRCIAVGSLVELRARFVPACELAVVQTAEPDKAIARAVALGYPYRHQRQELVFWLPESLELSTLIAQFAGVDLAAIARQSVGLEHVYREAIANAPEGAIP